MFSRKVCIHRMTFTPHFNITWNPRYSSRHFGQKCYIKIIPFNILWNSRYSSTHFGQTFNIKIICFNILWNPRYSSAHFSLRNEWWENPTGTVFAEHQPHWAYFLGLRHILTRRTFPPLQCPHGTTCVGRGSNMISTASHELCHDISVAVLTVLSQIGRCTWD